MNEEKLIALHEDGYDLDHWVYSDFAQYVVFNPGLWALIAVLASIFLGNDKITGSLLLFGAALFFLDGVFLYLFGWYSNQDYKDARVTLAKEVSVTGFLVFFLTSIWYVVPLVQITRNPHPSTLAYSVWVVLGLVLMAALAIFYRHPKWFDGPLTMSDMEYQEL